MQNNINIEAIKKFTQTLQSDSTKARKTQVIEGEWVLDDENAQFQSKLKYEGGEAVVQVDNPTFMGGKGQMPGPMHYCFFGLAACYTSIFVSVATSMGIVLKSLKTRVEADVNFNKVFGVSEDPVMEQIRVILTVSSDADHDQLRAAEKMALDRCPVVYTIRNIIPLQPELEFINQ